MILNKQESLPLDTVFDLYCDSRTYRHMASERAALYQSKPRAYEHSRQLTRDHLLLSDKDKAIALLLNTEPEHDHFYSNHLLACLSAILHPTGCHGNAHSTLKLVATHLIASGHIWQGIEILILNGQVPDACRYLQANIISIHCFFFIIELIFSCFRHFFLIKKKKFNFFKFF